MYRSYWYWRQQAARMSGMDSELYRRYLQRAVRPSLMVRLRGTTLRLVAVSMPLP